MPSRYTVTDAEAYEQLMGHWNPALARELIAWAGICPATGSSISAAVLAVTAWAACGVVPDVKLGDRG